jgi:hypothetical protein
MLVKCCCVKDGAFVFVVMSIKGKEIRNDKSFKDGKEKI